MVAAVLMTIVMGFGAIQGTVSDSSADVPRTRWEYRALATLERGGITVVGPSTCIAFGQTRNRTITRYEIAVGIDRSMRNLAERKLTKRFAGLLRQLVLAYTVELRELGDTEAMRASWLRMLWRHAPDSGPFPDVERSHWAAGAVQRMRESGVLRGYPDGLYRG